MPSRPLINTIGVRFYSSIDVVWLKIVKMTSCKKSARASSKTHVLWNRVHNGPLRSLILAPIESAYATSNWSSLVILDLPCLVSEILQVFCWEERPHPYSTRILGVFPLDYIADVVAPRSEDHVINFELVQPMLTVPQRYRRTDGRLTIAILCFLLRALRGKN